MPSRSSIIHNSATYLKIEVEVLKDKNEKLEQEKKELYALIKYYKEQNRKLQEEVDDGQGVGL
jgi:FtsZ-binding cell division protein ZapB